MKAKGLDFQHQSLGEFASSVALRHNFSLAAYSADGHRYNHASLDAPTHSTDALDPPPLLSAPLNQTP